MSARSLLMLTILPGVSPALRTPGLVPGRYSARDSVSGTDLGTIDAASPSRTVSFNASHLVEAVRLP